MNFSETNDGIPYSVDTEVFSGPLDLLLDLIQRSELDITKLSLAKVTDQYIYYIEQLQAINAADISEFLVIASKLIQIKSEALLPRPIIRPPDEEDIGEALARQLVIYRKVKQIASWLREREDKGLRTYIHIAKPISPKVNVDMSEINLDDLVSALQMIYHSEAEVKALGTVISIPKLTLKRKISSIISGLMTRKTLFFNDLLENDRSKINRLIVFLAILELVKQNYVITRQSEVFGDFSVIATERVSGNEELELTIDD